VLSTPAMIMMMERNAPQLERRTVDAVMSR
jgi:hypothetical protein